MRKTLPAILGAATLAADLVAQGSAPPAVAPSIYKSAAEVSAELDKADIVSMAGGAVSIYPGIWVRRRSADSPQYAIMHPTSIEIYQIVDGSATLVTGGTLALPLTDSTPAFSRSNAIEGGTSRKVGKGDIIVTPPATPHWFSRIDGSVTYLEARIPVTDVK